MSIMSRTLLFAVAGLGLVACGGGKPAVKSPTSPGVARPAVSAKTATLVSLENGDRACYVALKQADGSETSLEGDFDLCPGGGKDASALIGKAVTWTTRTANVLAESCQGDVDCGKSDEVELVVTLTAAP